MFVYFSLVPDDRIAKTLVNPFSSKITKSFSYVNDSTIYHIFFRDPKLSAKYLYIL